MRVSELRFSLADVAGVRLAVSPANETVMSMWALASPVYYAVHLPWIDRARVTLRRPEVAARVRPLVELTRPHCWLPDFLTPAARPNVEMAEQLDQIAATPPDVVVRDLLATTPRRPLGAFGRALLTDPRGLLPQVVDAVRVWYDEAIAPDWPQMRALLDADVAYRAAQLAEGGAGQFFEQLHPSLRWHGDRVVSDDPFERDFDLRGRGLALNPGVFTDRRVLWNLLEDSLPAGVYPVRAVGTLWETAATPPGDPLARVIGPGRAALLHLLETAVTTTDLARLARMSAGNVSQHLTALHAAGLVSRSRQGRHVLYRNTDAAKVLLRASRGG
ncbi:DNA-binding transcriptional ArsR family regulator [Micromonospora luteifusca]|uniref:DNA-binding transcriptional ArsR family regulator n=1 Tax=Micromonospora luteifusca TaxID=709860 RepID=A0ABS2LUW3_9ACTN|nr:ArsR family transcriptional regulator [Micromonospora luteifusca]MBM7491419.1 DNA-binding transcriptional ArsR family regulator [Micromonospora luteifusca]